MSAFRPTRPFLTPILTPKARVGYGVLVLLWIVASLWFWVWWLNPDNIGAPVRFGLITALLGWITFLQIYFIFFFMRAVRSSAPDPLPGQFRVAMIVTKTPSEPLKGVQLTLHAMLDQDYPHDTWLADEDPDAETIAWCKANGVRISSRKGVAEYHRPVWPRRTRCKEGNLAYFYDHWGYEDYDVVSQLDADHVPQPGYLREMLRPFADPEVGYVSAPSICASNATQNWAARTRLHTEGAFHGILQAGYSNGFAPMCIGSHYAVRTTALKEVGGLGPDLAEDHSTTLLLNAGGWRGVHALDAIAIGDGPVTIADLATQEFQWSRSLVTLLLQHSSRYLPKLPLRLKAQFLFCQLLYPILAVTSLAIYILPMLAVTFDIRFAEVNYPDYLYHAVPQVLVLLVIAISLRLNDLFRPTSAPVISWERTLFIMLQWPWVLWGWIAAMRDRFTGKFVDFRITPKGEAATGRLPAKIILVYGALALGCILPVYFSGELKNAQGFYLLSLFLGFLYTITLSVIVLRQFSENRWRLIGSWGDAAAQFCTVALAIALFSSALNARAAESAYALSIGLKQFQIVDLRYHVAGAGSNRRKPMEYHFRFRLKDPIDGLLLPPKN